MRAYHSIDSRERPDGLFDCFEVVRDAKDANPSNPILEESLVAGGVSKEYATCLENEYAREVFRAHGDYAVKMFGHVGFMTRRIGMFAEDNPHFAEGIKPAIVY